MRIQNTMNHAFTNTHSASSNPPNTLIKHVGLRKFTSYLYQYTTTGSQQLQYNNSNIGPLVNLQYRDIKTQPT